MEQPVAEQYAEQYVFEQPAARENIVEEIRPTEPAPVAVMPEQRFVPEPEIERPQAPPVAPKPQAPPVWKMEPVALPSDLVMIETQSKPAPAYQEQDAPRPARTPRPRQQKPVMAEEPLQQVETGKQQTGGDAAG
ncbi:MAG TPA: hypothetical protein VF934_12240 [Burkholderiales bacterium]